MALIAKSEYVNVAQELAGYYAVLEEAYLNAAIETAVEQEVVQSHTSFASPGGARR